jgi:hypothetical protein
MKSKECRTCCEVKVLAEFSRNNAMPDKYQPICKTCKAYYRKFLKDRKKPVAKVIRHAPPPPVGDSAEGFIISFN